MPSPELFFDLKNFSHSKLFEGDSPVWIALTRIKPYCDTLKLGAINCEVPSSVHLVNPETISIGEGTVIEPGAYIEGPCVIGKECQIRHGSYIRPWVITGDCCVIGHATELKASILLNHVHASHFNYVGDSILGNNVNMGAGAVCANVRLDRREVVACLSDKRFKTGLSKFGGVIGDGSQLGCNSVVCPGVMLSRKTAALPCSSIQRSNF